MDSVMVRAAPGAQYIKAALVDIIGSWNPPAGLDIDYLWLASAVLVIVVVCSILRTVRGLILNG